MKNIVKYTFISLSIFLFLISRGCDSSNKSFYPLVFPSFHFPKHLKLHFIKQIHYKWYQICLNQNWQFFFQEFFNFLVGQAFATIRPCAHLGGFLKILLKFPSSKELGGDPSSSFCPTLQMPRNEEWPHFLSSKNLPSLCSSNC